MTTLSLYIKRADNYIGNSKNLLAMVGSALFVSGAFVTGIELLVNTLQNNKLDTPTNEAFMLFGSALIVASYAKTYIQNGRNLNA